MKRIITTVFLLAALPGYCAMVATNAFNLQSVATATNNGTAFDVVNVNVPQRIFLIQNQGISGQVSSNGVGTNSLKVNVQMSFDGSNWVNFATYTPARTNATVDTFSPNFTQMDAFMRVQVATTNTITVGVTAVKP